MVRWVHKRQIQPPKTAAPTCSHQTQPEAPLYLFSLAFCSRTALMNERSVLPCSARRVEAKCRITAAWRSSLLELVGAVLRPKCRLYFLRAVKSKRRMPLSTAILGRFSNRRFFFSISPPLPPPSVRLPSLPPDGPFRGRCCRRFISVFLSAPLPSPPFKNFLAASLFGRSDDMFASDIFANLSETLFSTCERNRLFRKTRGGGR
mmetsp:Transcript_14670/g.34784  ORF Transcript_14670/g.34784 Transcript_14670/m.34784 type:complete len:205 (+) Transcript_14670:139-753(+)